MVLAVVVLIRSQMIFSKFLRSNSFRAPFQRRGPPAAAASSSAVPFLRFSSSLAAPKPNTAAAPKPNTAPAPPKPNTSLSSIFAKPSPQPNPKPKPSTASVKGNPRPSTAPVRGKPKTAAAPVKGKAKSKGAAPPRRDQGLGEKDSPEFLSPEAAALVRRLEEGGYLKGDRLSNVGTDKMPAGDVYPRRVVRTVAERFGQDHQEIAKWLSGSALKKVALFGCPSLERKTTFAAKRLRAFFRIEEDVICRGCRLKTSCQVVNRRVEGQNKVILADAMWLITSLSLKLVSQRLLIPDDLKPSVDRLLKEVVSLSS